MVGRVVHKKPNRQLPKLTLTVMCQVRPKDPESPWEIVAQTTTDEDGRFTMPVPASPRYQIIVRSGDRKESHYLEGYQPGEELIIHVSRL